MNKTGIDRPATLRRLRLVRARPGRHGGDDDAEFFIASVAELEAASRLDAQSDARRHVDHRLSKLVRSPDLPASTHDGLPFYDALGVNDSAVQVLGDGMLRDIARELDKTVRNNLTIDWTRQENVRANLRRLVKRVLRKHGCPPDK